jgi:hypothetical protein
MLLTVYRVIIPAWSTIGYGTGRDENGTAYRFVGDHRPMRHLGEIVAQTASEDKLPTVDLEDWQILNHSPVVL